MIKSGQADWHESVTSVAVLGAGAMGEGIAQNFAEAGLMVRLYDPSHEALARCKRQIEDNVRLARAKGVAGDDPITIASRLTLMTDGSALDASRDCDLIIESAPERLDLKREIFALLVSLPDNIVIATNTSSMTVDAICDGLPTSNRIAGLHYFNPAHIIPAVEIHTGSHTAPWVLTGLRGLMERCGKVPFLVKKSIPGLVINRLTAALMREIGYLLDEGVVDAADLDAGVKASIGFRMACVGPMEGSDFTGLDIGERVQSALFPTLSDRHAPSRQLTDRVERGELGIKTLKGWYTYRDGDRERLLNDRNNLLLEQLALYKSKGNSKT